MNFLRGLFGGGVKSTQGGLKATTRGGTRGERAELHRRIRRLEISTGRLVATVYGGAYRSVFKGRGIEFDEVREYQEGDDPRLIDWNVTARMDRLFVKKFIEERELSILLVKLTHDPGYQFVFFDTVSALIAANGQETSERLQE